MRCVCGRSSESDDYCTACGWDAANDYRTEVAR